MGSAVIGWTRTYSGCLRTALVSHSRSKVSHYVCPSAVLSKLHFFLLSYLTLLGAWAFVYSSALPDPSRERGGGTVGSLVWLQEECAVHKFLLANSDPKEHKPTKPPMIAYVRLWAEMHKSHKTASVQNTPGGECLHIVSSSFKILDYVHFSISSSFLQVEILNGWGVVPLSSEAYIFTSFYYF